MRVSGWYFLFRWSRFQFSGRVFQNSLKCLSSRGCSFRPHRYGAVTDWTEGCFLSLSSGKCQKKQNKNSLRLKRGKKRKWEGKLAVRWTNSQRMFWCHQRRVGPAAQPGTAGTKRPGFLDALPSTRRSPLETRGSSGKHVSRQLTFPRFGKKIGEGQK